MTQHLPVAVGSVLVVDDSPVQRAYTVDLLRALGVPLIYEASGGAEAIKLLQLLVLPPDLLVLDLEMPGMDGVETIGALHGGGFLLPLIVASGREAALIHAVETMARQMGMPTLAGLRKPLSLAGMHEALLRWEPAGSCPSPEGAAAKLGITLPGAGQLREAIEAERIEVYFQPKVDMRTGFVRGVEALARWNLDEGGWVPPDRFVMLAEREGLIHALTMAVARRALAQAARWNAHGLKLSMALNLSPKLLAHAPIVDDILGLAAAAGLPHEQIVLELTESSVVDHLAASLSALARLRLKGFGLSIDDYGTGFSSMQQLARVPFTELKIDRSFVHGAHRHEHLRVILESALEMARRLGLVAVAEGIESLADWQLLQRCGCDVGQGYLIGRPMPATELPAWLRRHQARLNELRDPRAPHAGP